jgi:hypothetical protein
MHAALRLAGSAGRVRHHAQIVGAGGQRAGRDATFEHVLPRRDAVDVEGLARRGDKLGHRNRRRPLQIIAIRRDDHMFEPLPWPVADQRLDVREQALRRDDRGRAAVLDVGRQLFKSTNIAASSYATLTTANANVIERFGSAAQKRK